MSAPKIMVVEDEVVVGMMLSSKLNTMGYVVTGIVANGEEVVEKVKQMAPDLVLMDIKLAGRMDGIEAARLIHECSHVPVVFLTAHSDDTTLGRAKLAEPYGYLVKPFSDADLHTAVEVSMYKHKQNAKERQLAELFSSVLDFTGGAVIAVDETGSVKHMSPMAEILTGWSKEEALHKKAEEVYLLKDLVTKAVITNVAREVTSAGSPTVPARYILMSRYGEEIPIESAVVSVSDAEGAPSNVLHCFRETGTRVKDRVDWFSHAANLRIAGTICLEEENFSEAESFYRRALEIMEENLGSNHPRVARILEDLLGILRQMGKDDDATLVEMRILRIRADGIAANERQAAIGLRTEGSQTMNLVPRVVAGSRLD